MSESITQLSRRCPRCGRTLPLDAAEGLCAACLLLAAGETLTATRGSDGADTVAAGGERGRAPGTRPLEGDVWGPYRIGRLLGRGGMGEVYEAEQLETGRRVALKVLRDTLRSAEDRARFLREGQLAASISHPHTVYIYGSEEIGGAPAITMELLSAGTLKDRVQAEGPMPPSAAVAAVLDIIGGLDAAQAAGILHRDIKPSNCFVDSDGTVKVGDFGLSISTLARDVRHELTTTSFEGTPQFAAPEQLRGEPLDVRADIYAVGATLYYLLTGRAPIEAPALRDLVARVQSEAPASPRSIRADIPKGLAAVVLRCLAKSAGDRPQSYAELADLLRPYSIRDEVAAPLGVRFVAWILDTVAIGIVTWLLRVLAWVSGTPLPPGEQVVWSWLIGMSYFIVFEGRRGAGLGKQLMGLRVTSSVQGRWWPRIGLRAAVFTLPVVIQGLLLMAWIPSATPPVSYTTEVRPSGWHWNMPPEAALSLLLAILPFVLTALLFVTARRRNHWAGIHELVSGTRVAERNATQPATSPGKRSSAVEVVRASASATRVGPFVVHATIGEVASGRLLAGFDPLLRRRVWIHEVPPGTPPIDATRRDVSRPGRLHWLAGRRSATENWDAFEAPAGEPLATATPAMDWREARSSLSGLAVELDASSVEGNNTRLSLAHVWRRPDGQLVLLDFPWPESASPDDARGLDPVELLAASSKRTFARISEQPLPLSVSRLLNRLTSGASATLRDVNAELSRLAFTPSRPSRIRRALPMVAAAIPVVMIVLFSVVMLPIFARSFVEERGNLMMWMMWLTDSRGDAEFSTPAQRTAAEQYIAAHFGDQLTSEAFWNAQTPPMEPFLTMRRTAADIAARYPAVSPEELARASAILAPKLQEIAEQRAKLLENFPGGGRALPGFVASGFPALAVLVSLVCGVLSALAVPGGLFTQALRHAVVTRGGREIGRLHSVARVVIAWSPAIVWIAIAGVPVFGGSRDVSPEVASTTGLAAFALMIVGVIWSVVTPSRGPHDYIVGTWVVPR